MTTSVPVAAPERTWAIGAFISLTAITTNPYPNDPLEFGGDGLHFEMGSLGLRVSGRFGATSGAR